MLVRLVGAVCTGALVIVVLVRLVGAVCTGALVIVAVVIVAVVLVAVVLVASPKSLLNDLINLLKVPPANPQHVCHIHLGPFHFFHRRQPIDTSDSLLHPIHFPPRDQIHLVQHDAVRKRNLLHALVHLSLRPLLV